MNRWLLGLLVGLAAAPVELAAPPVEARSRGHRAMSVQRSVKPQRGEARRKRVRSRQRGGRAFVVKGGDKNTNAFYQSKSFSAHALVRRGSSPRIMVATPAGNSGLGLWFDAPGGKDRGLRLESKLREVGSQGLRGVSFTVSGPSRLDLRRVLLDSVRAIRDEEHGAHSHRDVVVKEAVKAARKLDGRTHRGKRALLRRLGEWLQPRRVSDPTQPSSVILERTAVGGAKYRMELVPLKGTKIATRGDKIALNAKKHVRFKVRFLTDRPALKPLDRILRKGNNSRQARNLGFLMYGGKKKRAGGRQKSGAGPVMLAGSWQYLTYFGRDSLITSALLGKRATPQVLSAAAGSVLDRVSPKGEVAHEEHVGEQATLMRLPGLLKGARAGKRRVTRAALGRLERPTHEYKMIDGEYLLPQLLETFARSTSPAEVKRTLTGPRLEALGRVVGRILDQTRRSPRGGTSRNMVHLRRGETVGNWRDSALGLGRGRTPLDVNAFLAPSALRALQRLIKAPGFPGGELLRVVARQRPRASRALASPEAFARALGRRAGRWDKAVDSFGVKVKAGQAKANLRRYMKTLAPEEQRALGRARLWSGATIASVLAGRRSAPELDRGVSFAGVALDGRGRPVPVMSTDRAFHLFYGEPSKKQLVSAVTSIFQPFPVGLATPVGLVSANPAYSGRKGDAATFSRNKYHGTVVWGWPQAMMKEGLQRQKQRFSGDPEVQKVLGRALRYMNHAQKNVGPMGASEFWSWGARNKRVVAVPFGQAGKHSNESNALQLWSNTR